MTICEGCGNPIVPGERMVAHMDDGPMWNAHGVLITPQPMSFTPFHERCFVAEGDPSPSGPEEA